MIAIKITVIIPKINIEIKSKSLGLLRFNLQELIINIIVNINQVVTLITHPFDRFLIKSIADEMAISDTITKVKFFLRAI